MNKIKESSDELNPDVVTTTAIERAPRNKKATDYVALVIATCGVGYMPIAPGTWGSLVGIAIYLLLRMLAESFANANEVIFLTLELLTIISITFVGIWAASRVERREGKKDPGKVVIDEVAGQLIALLPIGLTLTSSWRIYAILGFFLFRAFDILKPYPARKLESLPSGTGIVADDLVAGGYAALVLALAASVKWLW